MEFRKSMFVFATFVNVIWRMGSSSYPETTVPLYCAPHQRHGFPTTIFLADETSHGNKTRIYDLKDYLMQEYYPNI